MPGGVVIDGDFHPELRILVFQFITGLTLATSKLRVVHRRKWPLGTAEIGSPFAYRI
jgi:hypothetical protein